jgi:23S rRNA (uridine2552-2'-O)-methyltransferase
MTKKTSYFQGDKYNSLAKKDGYRSRAAYKLIQIQKEFNFIQPGDNVLELGSAPGGWSQVISKIINDSGSITAIDVLPMKKIKYVNFHQIDLVNIEKLNLKKMSIVLSDIAPNITGVGFIDTANMNSLLEIEISIVDKFLQIGGKYLCKCFEGDSLDFLAENLKDRFKFVKRLKPEASRSISRELYVLGIEKI